MMTRTLSTPPLAPLSKPLTVFDDRRNASCDAPTPYIDVDAPGVKSWSSANLTLSSCSPAYTDRTLNSSTTLTLSPPTLSTSSASESQLERPLRGLNVRTVSAQPVMASVRYLSDTNETLLPIAETIRRPYMMPSKFGVQGSWALDIFTLPHNAVRAECVDMYTILESIQARLPRVEPVELDEFCTWWMTFERFVMEYFDFEADVLFVWSFGGGSGGLRVPVMERKDGLLEMVRRINGTFELRRHVDLVDVVETVLEEVNEFVEKMIEYFYMLEKQVVPIVQERYAEGVRELVMRRYVAYIKQGEDPQMNLSILTRWMDGAVRETWVRQHVRGFTRLVYPRWERRCEREHLHIPYKFHRRLLRSVRNVAASRLRRRAEYGEEIDDLSYGSMPSQTGSFKSLTLNRGTRSAGQVVKVRRSRETSKSRTRLR